MPLSNRSGASLERKFDRKSRKIEKNEDNEAKKEELQTAQLEIREEILERAGISESTEEVLNSGGIEVKIENGLVILDLSGTWGYSQNIGGLIDGAVREGDHYLMEGTSLSLDIKKGRAFEFEFQYLRGRGPAYIEIVRGPSTFAFTPKGRPLPDHIEPMIVD